MGVRGPVPKRSDQRVRRNKVEPPTKVTAIGAVEVPPLVIEDPHPLTERFWVSLHESAQTQFYEPSDWFLAQLAAEVIDHYLRSSKRSSLALGEINKLMNDLMVSEAARRRLRLEIDRASVQEVAEVLDVASLFKQRMGVG